MRRIAITLFAFVSLGASAPQREPQLPHIGGETIEVSLVNLDVIVTNRRGERVHGLTAADFEVLEDGKPRDISNFTEFRSQRTAEAAASPVANELPAAPAPVQGEARPKRTIILFVDQVRLEPFKRDAVFAAMKQMLRDSVSPGDAVSILTWHGEPVTALEATDDLAKVDAALDEIAKGTTGVAGDPTADLRRSAVANIEFYRTKMNSARDRGYAIDLNSFMPPLDAYEAAIWLKAEMKRKAQAMKAMMNGFAGTPGRKILILASHRLSRTAGAEQFFAAGLALTQDRRAEF
ncbi:MAG: VWA domain-containing protein, partial [Acidobacteria bacterium]|nr:VWA domain-containing protein [Acidobacteriota bacterium]